MKHIEFSKYCKSNKVKEIEPNEFRIAMKFENGEIIFISTGYDGLVYTHEDELKGTGTENLFKQLQEMMPDQLERLKKKYSWII